jgi:G:T-mismatch repair DNA endonuclease (very short patch repair protein)
MGCFYHGRACQPLRDLKYAGGDTLAERYERTMSRLEQITGVGYTVRLIWECEWDAAKIV